MKETVYQLVKTPALTHLGDERFSTVYSILELEIAGEDVKSNFIYDVSRCKESAEKILKKVESAGGDEPIIAVLESVM